MGQRRSVKELTLLAVLDVLSPIGLGNALAACRGSTRSI